jgi:hypothetical protein
VTSEVHPGTSPRNRCTPLQHRPPKVGAQNPRECAITLVVRVRYTVSAACHLVPLVGLLLSSSVSSSDPPLLSVPVDWQVQCRFVADAHKLCKTRRDACALSSLRQCRRYSNEVRYSLKMMLEL